ncbi:hypothetical protein INH39_10770 [Massilia violaceinigra]|uniref:Uncharacterized protein n=1 Tax=Massilia violaceinigra TaxID=2045208 RepID=A0ABY4ABD9_9BURK|nr:hypothetical protein [Massilia violaceinigra]UOD32102.1 hypothetical protein INH39_10770 [Massilia violaceinigra]
MIVPARAVVNRLKTIAQAIAVIVLTLAAVIGAGALWWYAPVRVDGDNIVKVIGDGAAEDHGNCKFASMTAEQFRTYWKNARPIFDIEVHDYNYSPCQFKTMENGTEYLVGNGGLGSVTKGDTIYYWVNKDAKPGLNGID